MTKRVLEEDITVIQNNEELAAALKYRINNIVKFSHSQKVLETVLVMKKVLQDHGENIDGKTLKEFDKKLRSIEGAQTSYDTLKKRFDICFGNLTKSLQQLEHIRDYAPTAYPIFEKCHIYLDKLQSMIVGIPSFDEIKVDDFKGYIDLLRRIEDWIVDHNMYITKMKQDIQKNIS